MPIVRALVTLPKTSAIPEDASTNSWHFSCPLVDPTSELNNVLAALTSFYQAIDTYLALTLATTATVRYYNLADPKPRTPLREDTIALTLSTANQLPEEVAICLSYQGAKVSGANQARRRGRIYLGPLGSNVQASPNAGNRPSTTVISAIATAATALATAAFGNGTPWVVYSPTNEAAVNVTDGWVDNAFDTQRRRGVRATSRTLWT